LEKETEIKIILDQFCLQENLPLYSEAKIGRIIKLYKLFYQKTGKVYHNPNSKYAANRYKTKRLRIKYSPKPTDFGYIQMDTESFLTKWLPTNPDEPVIRIFICYPLQFYKCLRLLPSFEYRSGPEHK